jgi:hypothetical protein
MMIGLVRVVPIALAVSLVACVYDTESPHGRDRYADSDPTPSGGAASGPVGSTPDTASPASAAPMLVEVDTDQTMTADPGQGVGVFMEYAAGGHWFIWWTCDTAKTGQDCDFKVSATAATGTLSNVDASNLAGGFLTTPTPSRIDAQARTSNGVHGVAFDTVPGGVITVEASVGGVKDGSFLFFVQDGKVNGGYAGKVTNPLQLQGKTP